MGPKKAKEKQDESSWRKNIENAHLDDHQWKVKVIIFEASGCDHDRIYINKFETYAMLEKRFIIKNICKTETIFMVNQLGAEKSVKDESLRVFEEGYVYLKEKKPIPAEILALIIKHLILQYKEEYLYIQRQKIEVKEGIARESVTMVDRTEVRNILQPPKSPSTPDPTPKQTKKGEPEVIAEHEPEVAKKCNTLLRVRGEEWRDKVYVDDFPLDGPNIYVAVTDFVDPYLPESLVKIGVPVTALVQVRIDSNTMKVPSSLFYASKRGQSNIELIMDKYSNFWEILQQLRIRQDTANDYKNTAFIVFKPPYWVNDLSGDAEKIYDELCYLMYDVQDLSRQHLNYLDNMDIIEIPPDSPDLLLNKIYFEHIDELPLECVTIYSILDSILQAVSEKYNLVENDSTISSVTTAVPSMKYQETAVSCQDYEKLMKGELLVHNIFNVLTKTADNKKKYRITSGLEMEAHKDPIAINFGDYTKYRTFHLENTDLDPIVHTMLLEMPVHNIWSNQRQINDELGLKINLHLNVLLSCLERENIQNSELTRLLHLFACKRLYDNRSSIKKRHIGHNTVSEFKNIYLKRSIFAEPLMKRLSFTRTSTTGLQSLHSLSRHNSSTSHSLILPEQQSNEDPKIEKLKFLFECPDLSELMSAGKIVSNQQIGHMIDEFGYFEDYASINSFQTLLEAFNKYNSVDYKYCEVSDCIILMFFNSHDSEGISREEWRSHLPTSLCLQDFFDFVLEENYDWIKKEEEIYNENMKFKSECKVLIDFLDTGLCINQMDVEMELLMEGSLKYQEMTVLSEGSIEMSEIREPSSIKTSTKEFSVSNLDSKSSRKNKIGATSQKNIKPLIEEEKIPKQFMGYDLGDRRFEVFGKDANFFSNDGTKVATQYYMIIPINMESVVLNVVPGNDINEFWIHKVLGEFTTQALLDTCESFRITTKNNAIINIFKQTYQVPILEDTTHIDTSSCRDSETKTTFTNQSSISHKSEQKYYHSLFITWPNGLIIESVHEENSPNIAHIKQFYIKEKEGLDEDMRCINMNGEVIIFKKSGNIEVFQPDGVYIRITKCEKRVILTEVQDIQIALSEGTSGKNKLQRNITPNEKSTKSGAKPIKNQNAFDNENTSATQLAKTALFIDEYDFLEPNGIKQLYSNGIYTKIKKLLVRTTTDYCLGEIFSRRMDGTHILLNSEGVQIVTFPNNIRIISYCYTEDSEIFPERTKNKMDNSNSDLTDSDTNTDFSDSFKDNEGLRNDGYVSVLINHTIEHVNFATVSVNRFTEQITIDSPNNTSVVIDNQNHYDISLDHRTSACFDGETLHIDYEACSDRERKMFCDINMHENEHSILTNHDPYWLTMKDSCGQKIYVDTEGGIGLLESDSSEEEIQSQNFGTANHKDDKVTFTSDWPCHDAYEARSLRFFVLNRDLSSSELVNRRLVKDYENKCHLQPWGIINKYTQDRRKFLSMLSPVHLNETEKWLMESKLAEKPHHLTLVDLKKHERKGFYHWMRPYERFEAKPWKPSNIFGPRQPCAFITRLLEQHWKETDSGILKVGKGLVRAIVNYHHFMASIQESVLNLSILNPRIQQKLALNEQNQEIRNRIYEELKNKLIADVRDRAKVNITTKPMQIFEESLTERQDGFDKMIDEEIHQSPTLKRYWRRRIEEAKKEELYKYLLRDIAISPYFRNLLGGAIWWEINDTVDKAVDNVERGRKKCVCIVKELKH